jgi:hypothetical protein
MPHQRVFLIAVFTLAASACASDRFEANLASEHLSPKVQKMSKADVRAITRLVTDRTWNIPIICIYSVNTRDFKDEIWVIAASNATLNDSDNLMFRLKKENGKWRIIEGGFGLSTILISCEDS